MEALLQDPETTGVSVEILPDLFVPADVAWRVQVLVLGLAASLALLALDRGLIDAGAVVRWATAPRPVATPITSPPVRDTREPAPAVASGGDALPDLTGLAGSAGVTWSTVAAERVDAPAGDALE